MENFDLKIERLVLRNFRQFETLEIDFDEQLTVFIAENGGGKTTILDCLAGSLYYITEQIQQVATQSEPFDKDDIRWKQDNFDTELSLKPFSESPIRANFERRIKSTRFSFEEEYKLQELNQSARIDAANLPIIAYYPCYLAAMPLSNGQSKETETGRIDIFDTYTHCLDNQVLDFATLKKWLIGKFHLETENADTTFNFIREAIVGKNGMLNDTDKMNFTDMRVSYQNNLLGGDFLFIKSGVQLFEHQLSSGERSLMLLVADIARRLVIANPLSKNPLQEGTGVVLIDEIDLHLHPSWQGKVVGKLRAIFPNVQFVITTHSLETVKGLDRHNLRIIQDRKILSIVPYIKGRDSNAISEEVFGQSERLPEYTEQIKELYRKMETDREAAETLLEKLKEDLGATDAEILKAESYLEIF